MLVFVIKSVTEFTFSKVRNRSSLFGDASSAVCCQQCLRRSFYGAEIFKQTSIKLPDISPGESILDIFYNSRFCLHQNVINASDRFWYLPILLAIFRKSQNPEEN